MREEPRVSFEVNRWSMRELRWSNLVNARYFELGGHKAQSLCEFVLFKYARLQRSSAGDCAMLQSSSGSALETKIGEIIMCFAYIISIQISIIHKAYGARIKPANPRPIVHLLNTVLRF